MLPGQVFLQHRRFSWIELHLERKHPRPTYIHTIDLYACVQRWLSGNYQRQHDSLKSLIFYNVLSCYISFLLLSRVSLIIVTLVICVCLTRELDVCLSVCLSAPSLLSLP